MWLRKFRRVGNTNIPFLIFSRVVSRTVEGEATTTNDPKYARSTRFDSFKEQKLTLKIYLYVLYLTCFRTYNNCC